MCGVWIFIDLMPTCGISEPFPLFYHFLFFIYLFLFSLFHLFLWMSFRGGINMIECSVIKDFSSLTLKVENYDIKILIYQKNNIYKIINFYIIFVYIIFVIQQHSNIINNYQTTNSTSLKLRYFCQYYSE